MISSLWTCHCPQLQVKTLGAPPSPEPSTKRQGARPGRQGLSDQGRLPRVPLTPPPACPPDQVLRHFHELAQAYNLSIPLQELQVFVQEHFWAVGQELQPWTPEDWRDRYNPGHGTGEGPSLRAATLNPMGPVVFQPPVSAEDLGPQAASLGRAATPTLEEAGKEGISALDQAEGDGGGERVSRLGPFLFPLRPHLCRAGKG